MAQNAFRFERIQNNLMRRAVLVIMLPALIVWHFNWRLIVLPIAVIWNALEAAAKSAAESVRHDLTTPSMQILLRALKKLWAAPQSDQAE